MGEIGEVIDMRDDFAALDLFFSAENKTPVKRKKLRAQRRRAVKQKTQALPLSAAFLPLIAKMKKKPVANFSLQGWPVSLSWSAPRPYEREDFSHLLSDVLQGFKRPLRGFTSHN
jgi:hypothetical protein